MFVFLKKGGDEGGYSPSILPTLSLEAVAERSQTFAPRPLSYVYNSHMIGE